MFRPRTLLLAIDAPQILEREKTTATVDEEEHADFGRRGQAKNVGWSRCPNVDAPAV